MTSNLENQDSGKLYAYLKSKNASWADFMKRFFTKPAYLIVVVSNLALFFLPQLDLKNNALTFIWIYMVQSLMIGVVHVFKLNFYRFSLPTRPTDWKSPHALSVFFLFHYGFFHFVYYFFIPPNHVNWDVVLQGASIFMGALILNTMRHYKKENSGNYNANDFMLLPYVRIIPIHIAIILGGFLSAITGSYSGIFVVLAIMKTVLELFLEYMQHLGVSFSDFQNKAQE